jgi:hypothetical protein
MCNIFQWQWSAFYDGRETELKDVLDIDINSLSMWVDGDATRTSRVIYVEVVAPAGVAAFGTETLDLMPDATLDPAIRVKSGARLPNPLTVAAEWPLYTWGDYNSQFKKPASLAGDGITILSNAWRDDENRPSDDELVGCSGAAWMGNACAPYETWATGWANRVSSETTVNAGILAGHWPTPCDHEEPDCDGGFEDFYGGGIENFPRFLEQWSDVGQVVFHYTGALISPFTSQKTLGTWNGTYYVPPQRHWSFDLDFRNPALLPPATPHVGTVLRTGMREAF